MDTGERKDQEERNDAPSDRFIRTIDLWVRVGSAVLALAAVAAAFWLRSFR